MLAATSSPTARRSTARGLLGGQALKLLGISHTNVITEVGIGLRRRRRIDYRSWAKLRRSFQTLQEFEYRRHFFRADEHIQQDFVLRVYLREAHRDQPHIV